MDSWAQEGGILPVPRQGNVVQDQAGPCSVAKGRWRWRIRILDIAAGSNATARDHIPRDLLSAVPSAGPRSQHTATRSSWRAMFRLTSSLDVRAPLRCSNERGATRAARAR